MRIIPLLVVALALPMAAQESGKVSAFAPPKILDLVFRITDFAGNPVSEIAGTVQDLQVKEIGNEVHIELAADVLFDFDKADILPKAEETLTKAAAIVKERAKGTVRVEGHTDSKGDDAYNMRLSERRANAVAGWFRSKGGLAKVNFAIKGFGETQSIAPNQKADGSDDPEGRQKNRRVEIVMTK